MTLGALGFTAPWLLLGLLALPILWVLLRAVPPAPIRRRFPGVVLLLGLKDDDSTSDRTPWCLLLLRMLAVAAVIIGLAGPVLNPQDNTERGTGPVLIAMDGGWASARNWDERRVFLEQMLDGLHREGRPVAFVSLSDPEPLNFVAANVLRNRLPGLVPRAWLPDAAKSEAVIASLGDENFETSWMSDGLRRPEREALLQAFEAHGAVTIYERPIPIVTITPPDLTDGEIELRAQRSITSTAQEAQIDAIGRDPNGNLRTLATISAMFEEGEAESISHLTLPAELRARVSRFQVAGQNHAGAVTLSGDRLKRREVALIAGREDREGLELLSPLHYLERAVMPAADILDGTLLEVIPANPDVIVLADVATLAQAEQAALMDWTNGGGFLIRFAGPRLAASDIARSEESPLMPVRLRSGGRVVGGAMSWGAPKTLAPFAEDSPFYGLPVQDEVTVNAQVMAQPDPSLAERVIAQLSDGTPLVTRKRLGAGQVVLFHVTANTDWSSLPLSGLFVQMLERLTLSSTLTSPDAGQMAGTIWQPVEQLDGFGRIQDASTLSGVTGEDLLEGRFGPDLPPGLYEGPDQGYALNPVKTSPDLRAENWPNSVQVHGFGLGNERDLSGWLIAFALALLAIDILASLAVSGRLHVARVSAVLLAAFLSPEMVPAQDSLFSEKIEAASNEVVLGYVITGNTSVDETSNAGLVGLAQALFARTSVEPAAPIGVDLEADDLSLYPMIYWPVTADQPLPSPSAYARLNTYLRTGGLILFDTRDANVAGFGASSPTGARLQRLAAPLDIPPLEPVPQDHVLTRTFYLLQDFPGRHTGQPVWVEAAPADAEQIEGMPFRNLNDGVTPVVIGGNDWASAWAVDANGAPMFPIGRGFAGERQRELARRFGVNLIMHVLTGNYKSDQVHVPALLERLGQ